MREDRIGKYRIIGKLGQGGMARVLLTSVAGPHGFHKLLVVKELKEDLVHDPEFLAMFLDEARLAAQLNHPNVVQTFEVGEEAGRFVIVMEYLEGQPLHSVYRRVGRQNIPVEVHVRILADVLAGLEYAHTATDFDGSALRIVHRDISPQNVFVTYDGHVKVLDFGIAKAAGASTSTKEGVFKGKLSYVAPEQARGAPVDARTDLFAVGVMMWEALAGRRMVQRDTEVGVLARRITGNDPKVREVAPDVPRELAEICDKAMALDPDGRFESARAFQETLEDYLDQAPYRAGPKEISLLVATAFQEERKQIRELVEQQMQRQRAAMTSDVLPLVELASVMPPSAEPTPITHHPASLETLAGSPMINGSVPAPSRSKMGYVVGAVGAVAIGAAVIGGTVLLRKTPPAGASTGAEPAAQARSEVEVIVRFGPEGARATVDGNVVTDNPLKLVGKPGDKPRELEVTLDGHRAERRSISFERDTDMTVVLLGAAGQDPLTLPDRTAAPVGVGRPSRPTQPTTTATAVATPPATPPTGTDPEPTRTAKPPRFDIDEQDPYKKDQGKK